MFVKPGENTFEPELLGRFLKVRIPHTHALIPEEGMEVPENLHGQMKTHWDLLIRDGDVVVVKQEVPEVSVSAGKNT